MQRVDLESHVATAVRTGRHDSQAVWSQREADWKVRATGDRVDVASADVEQDGNDEWTDVATEAEAWANVVLQDRARGATDYADELTLTSGASLVLREPYGPRKVFADVEFATAGGENE